MELLREVVRVSGLVTNRRLRRRGASLGRQISLNKTADRYPRHRVHVDLNTSDVSCDSRSRASLVSQVNSTRSPRGRLKQVLSTWVHLQLWVDQVNWSPNNSGRDISNRLNEMIRQFVDIDSDQRSLGVTRSLPISIPIV